jgi:hypothetical protein
MTTIPFAADLSMIESIQAQYRAEAVDVPAVEKTFGVAKGGSPL